MIGYDSLPPAKLEIINIPPIGVNMNVVINKDTDQTVWMRRLICIYCLHIALAGFVMKWLIYRC